jgi:hypothetical protein
MSKIFWTARAVKYNNKLANLTPVSYFLSPAFSGVGNTRVILDGFENDVGDFALDTKQWRGIDRVVLTGARKDASILWNRQRQEGQNWEFVKGENLGPGINGRNNVQLPKGQEKGRFWQPHSKKFNLSDGQFVKKTAELVRNLASQNIGLDVRFAQKKNGNQAITEAESLIDFKDVSRSYRIVINELTPQAKAECDKLSNTKDGFDLIIGSKGNIDTAYGDEGQDFFASNIYNYMVYFKNAAARQFISYNPLEIAAKATSVAKTFETTPLLKSEGYGKLEHLLANHYSDTFIGSVSDVDESFGYLHYALGVDGTYAFKFEFDKNVKYSNRLGVFSTKQDESWKTADIDQGGTKPFLMWAPTKKGQTKELADFVSRVVPLSGLNYASVSSINSFSFAADAKTIGNAISKKIQFDQKTKDVVVKMEDLANRYYNNICKTAVLYANEIDEAQVSKTGVLSYSLNSVGKLVYKLVNVLAKKEVPVIKSERIPVLYATLSVNIAANALAKKLMGQNFEGYRYGMFNANPGDSARHYKNPVVSIQFLRQYQFIKMRLDRIFGLEETNFFHILKDAKHQRAMQTQAAERSRQQGLAQAFDAIKVEVSPELLNKRWQSATLLAQGKMTPSVKTVVTTSKTPTPISNKLPISSQLPIPPKTVVPPAIKVAVNLPIPKNIAPTPIKALALKGLSGYGLDGYWSNLGASPMVTAPKLPTISTPNSIPAIVVQKSVATAVAPSINNSAERSALLNFLNANRSKLANTQITMVLLSGKRRTGKLNQVDIDLKKTTVKSLIDLANGLNTLEQALNTKNALIAQQELKTQADINARFDNALKIISQKDIDLLKSALSQTVARVMALKDKVTSSEKDLLLFAQASSVALQALLTAIQPLVIARNQNKASAPSVITLETTLKAIKNLADAFADKQASIAKEIKETPITATTPEATVITPSQADASVVVQTIPVSEEQAQQQEQAVAQVVAQQVPTTDSATPAVAPVVEASNQVGTSVSTLPAGQTSTDAPATVVPTSTNTTTTEIIPATADQPAQVVTTTTSTVVPPTDIPAPVIDASVSSTPQVAPPPAPEQSESGAVIPPVVAVDPTIKSLEASVSTQIIDVPKYTDTRSVAPATEDSAIPKETITISPAEIQQIKLEEQNIETTAENIKATEAAIKITEELREENADKQPLIPIGPMSVRSNTMSEEEREVAQIKEELRQVAKDQSATAGKEAEMSKAKDAIATSQPKGLSTGSKVAIGSALVATIAGGIYFYNKNKSE